MKTIFAVEKSEYLTLLMKFIGKCSEIERRNAYNRMKEIEEYIKSQGDEIRIVITTRDTDNIYTAPAMSEEEIEKNKHL